LHTPIKKHFCIITENYTLDIKQFYESLKEEAPDQSLPIALKALWYDAKNDWNKAHHLADEIGGPNCDWVHAYLHRKEGDSWNANYWYRRAGKTRPEVSLAEEWEIITRKLLGHKA